LKIMTQKTLKILNGWNEGAEIQLELGVPILLGSHADSTVVLSDAGIEEQHCQLMLTTGGIVCASIGGTVMVRGREFSPGEIVKIPYMQRICCGGIDFAIGDTDADWGQFSLMPPASSTAAKEERRWQSLLRGLVSMPAWKRNLGMGIGLAGFASLLGIAYASMAPQYGAGSAAYVDEARRWLKTVEPAGSELHIDGSQGGQLVLTGYVGSNYENELLGKAVRQSSYRPRVDVYAVEQMVSSLGRLANLESLPCIVQYLGKGRLGCNNDIEASSQAVRLQVLAQQVPGVKALETRLHPHDAGQAAAQPVAPASIGNAGNTGNAGSAASIANAAEAPAASLPASIGTIAQFPRKLSVMMSKRERSVFDAKGMRFTEGDVIDGFKLTSIEFDQVWLEKDGRQFLVRVGSE
jgi:hypothetical protein